MSSKLMSTVNPAAMLTVILLMISPSEGFLGFLSGLGGFGGFGGRGGKKIQPVAFRLPKPPTLQGPTAPNTALATAEIVHMGKLQGPASFVNTGEDLFVATKDNKIYNVARCQPKLIVDMRPQGCRTRQTCGQLISLRKDPTTGDLLALDSFRGIFRVNSTTGETSQLFSSQTPVNGRAPVHLNDFVITRQGFIIMSDSSDSHDFDNDIYIGMEGRTDGRLIAFIPSSGAVNQLRPKFSFPNGLELTSDEKNLLVVESTQVRVVSVSLETNTFLSVTPLSNNLPGIPDNIRASDHGTFWVCPTCSIEESDGLIFFQHEHDVQELIAFIPSSGAVNQLRPRFSFPNGLELTSDEKNLLVVESTQVRVVSVSLETNTFLSVTPLSNNLPGIPDNIRASDHGTFWVGMMFARHAASKNPMDLYSSNTMFRSMGAQRMSKKALKNMFSRWAIAVELDASGKILRSIQDPKAARMSSVTEVSDYGGVLNIGSVDSKFMTRILDRVKQINADTFMQVVRSRCKIPVNQVDMYRKKAMEVFNKPTTTTNA
ncbi:adipocyte plasma membrane-associated protein [Aplysia californica]|uniref:Adipocyte plasma membrane-associated protein n=1 Tax=Aplysia californica TaxID=6500 RepID=A0ABM0ZVU3_APLCA|nr:adipocyte plasma membrane-associated protein [Aplysia californica]